MWQHRWFFFKNWIFLRYFPNKRIMSYLDAVGFWNSSIRLNIWFEGRFNIHLGWAVTLGDPHFLSVVWESTITLEDVIMQLELPIDSDVVTCLSKVAEPSTLYYQFLRRSPGDEEAIFTSLKFSWLNENFQTLSSSAT